MESKKKIEEFDTMASTAELATNFSELSKAQKKKRRNAKGKGKADDPVLALEESTVKPDIKWSVVKKLEFIGIFPYPCFNIYIFLNF